MATRKPPVELFYDPEKLDPDAPRLRVGRNGVGWELRDDAGILLSTHPSQADAIDAALDHSKVRFSEILVRGATRRVEWAVDQDPAAMRWARELDRVVESQRWGDSRGDGRRRIGVPSRYHHVFMPCRYRHDKVGEGEPVRGRAVELFYDPAELDPVASRLRVGKNGGAWELRQDDGTLLSAHDSLPEAIDAGLVRSGECFSEILVRNSTGWQEWSVHHNPGWIDIVRRLVRTAPWEREAAA